MSDKLSSQEKIDDKEVSIDRVVPISSPEIIGIYAKKDNSAILLEFGYIKNEKSGDIVIDVRKELSLEMAENLYSDLKEIFESSSED